MVGGRDAMGKGRFGSVMLESASAPLLRFSYPTKGDGFAGPATSHVDPVAPYCHLFYDSSRSNRTIRPDDPDNPEPTDPDEPARAIPGRSRPGDPVG